MANRKRPADPFEEEAQRRRRAVPLMLVALWAVYIWSAATDTWGTLQTIAVGAAILLSTVLSVRKLRSEPPR